MELAAFMVAGYRAIDRAGSAPRGTRSWGRDVILPF
jgi:hypothetical protein